MKIAIERFLKDKNKEIEMFEVVKTEELYSDITNKDVSNIFSILHQEFNRLFRFIYSKSNMHLNAYESRQLINYIKVFQDVEYKLKDTEYAFYIDKEYEQFINRCSEFLVPSYGSEIPPDLKKIIIIDYEPIFFIKNSIKVSTPIEDKHYQIKLIGEGSYAKVYKYKDEFYGENYVIKKALNSLSEKELERFKKEYNTMNSLNSPYILQVHKYNAIKNEYIMEYANETIYDYIKGNNNKIDLNKRVNLIMQIIKGFEYIHSKGYLHRDISLTNVLIKHYDHTSIIKISDFGLVKEKYSNLTSTNTEFKGSLNDSQLNIIGFKNYSIEHEIYALTRLIFYVFTGRTNLEKEKNKHIENFLLKGTNSDSKIRYKDMKELRNAVNEMITNIKK